MGEADEGYWLLSETSGIGETRDPPFSANCRCWKDDAGLLPGGEILERPVIEPGIWRRCVPFVVAFVWTLVGFGRDFILFPALAGFLTARPAPSDSTRRAGRLGKAGRSRSDPMVRVRPRAGAGVLHRAPAQPVDAPVDARRSSVWSLFFGVTAFPASVMSSAFCLAQLPAGRACDRYGHRRRSPPSPSRSASSRSLCCSTAVSMRDRHGDEHEAGLEQPADDDRVGRHGAGAVRCLRGDGTGWHDRHLPAARPRNMARL